MAIENEELIENQEEEFSGIDADLLNMSDDDLANLDLDSYLAKADLPEEQPEQEQPQEEPSDEDVEPEASQEADEAETDEEEEQEEAEEPAIPEDPAKEESTDQPAQPEPVPAEQEVDYKAAYEKLTAPFRANGKEMKVDNIDDAITLMQMGANYNKKMAALKPNLKLLKLLENNGLLNEEKISFLIDLEKKNPQAIGKLVKDSGLDPLDMEVEQNGYKPQTYTVDDRELELDEVLGEIQDTPHFSKTIEVVTNKFDAKSKQIVADNPQLLKVINTHVERGIYDLISTEVERARMLGRLNGLSDLEAYKQVGDALEANGAFDHLVTQRQATPPQRVAAPVPAKPKVDPKLNEKKRAASPTKAAPTAVPNKEDFNPLALSDEEFEKLANTKLM